MKFYVGLHQPSDPKKMPGYPAFISVNRLSGKHGRKGDFEVGDWIMDSGAFSELKNHGHFRLSVEEYASWIDRWSRCGQLVSACSQDYMCEPFMFEGQDFNALGIPDEKLGYGARKFKEEVEYLLSEGFDPMWCDSYICPPEEFGCYLTVEIHQRQTVERFVELKAAVARLGCKVYILPVLQGYEPEEYVECVKMYEAEGELPPGAYVGVGSVCKRNTNVGTVERLLVTIKSYRPDLKLHGFGLKRTALESPMVRALLYSSDSMAWSDAARKAQNKLRKAGKDPKSIPGPNSWIAAKEYADIVERLISGDEPWYEPNH